MKQIVKNIHKVITILALSSYVFYGLLIPSFVSSNQNIDNHTNNTFAVKIDVVADVDQKPLVTVIPAPSCEALSVRPKSWLQGSSAQILDACYTHDKLAVKLGDNDMMANVSTVTDSDNIPLAVVTPPKPSPGNIYLSYHIHSYPADSQGVIIPVNNKLDLSTVLHREKDSHIKYTGLITQWQENSQFTTMTIFNMRC